MAEEPQTEQAPRKFRRSSVWLGRFIGVFVVPVVFLLLLEGGLRVVGLREPTDFFIRNEGRPGELTTNLKFGWQYFPPPIARWPRPQVIAGEKPPDQTRVVVLGESAAFGTPSEMYGFPHQLEVLLDAPEPVEDEENGDGPATGATGDWQVINAAMTAINSHTIYQIARDLPKVDPDYVVLYIGNNEVIGPYASGSVFGASSESLGTVRTLIALRKSALGQLVSRIATGGMTADDQNWQGLANFLDHQMQIDDPRLAVIYAHFEENLRDIVAQSHAAGARVVLCTVAVNLADAPPFASALPVDWDDAQIAEFEKDLDTASAAFLERFYADTEMVLKNLLERAPQHALANYLMGLTLAQYPGAGAEAAKYFVRARDYDTLRFRADSRINEIIRQVAAEELGPDDVFLDLAELLAQRASNPAGLPGGDVFYEHVHFNFPGNFTIALALAETLKRMENQPWAPGPLAEMAPEDFEKLKNRNAYRVAWTHLEFVRITDEMLQGLLAQPPFITRWNAEAYLDRKSRQWSEHRDALLSPENILSSARIARDAAGARPDDLYLRESLLMHALTLDDMQMARNQAQFLTEAIPTDYLAWTHLGTIYLHLGKPQEAEAAFTRALRLNPYYRVARNNLDVARQRVREAEER